MKKSLLLLSLSLFACRKSPSDPGPKTAVSVIVASPQTVMVVNRTVQLSASAYDNTGKRIIGAAIEWESLQPQLATVSATGLLTALTVGTVTVRASADGKEGEAQIDIDPDPCTTPLTLSVGQVRQLSGPAAVACVTLAATSGATAFLFVTSNASQSIDELALYSVSQPQLSPLARVHTAPSVLDPRAVVERQAIEFEDRVEGRIREQERALLPRLLPQRRSGAALALSPAEPSLAVAPTEGQTVTYRVPDVNANDLCVTYKDVSAVVKKVSQHAVIAQDVTAPANGFTQTDFNDIAAEFESLIYPTDTAYFGAPTDRNDDGHITILYTSEVNKGTPAGASGFVAGFFWGGDLVRKSEYQQVNKNCPQTNEQEIFYLLVPDPNGTINSNPRSVATVRQNTRGTIAHEFQHMINQGLRLLNPVVDSSEVVWLNEALSHFAEEIVGRVTRGFSEMQNLTFSDVNPTPNSADDYNAFFRQNLLRLRPWMQRPDTSSAISNKARNQLAPRGAGWIFLRYLVDHYSGGNPKAYLRHLVAGPDIGLRNILQWSGGQFDDILRGYLVAMFTDEFGVANLPALYSVPSWRVRDVMASVNSNVFPLQVTTLPTTITTQSLAGSGNYFRLTRTGASPATTFRMLSFNGSPVATDGARVYVVRLQ